MERPYFPIASASLNQVFRRKNQRLASRKLLAKRSSRKTLHSNIDDIDGKIEHCLQKAEDTFNINTYLEEFSNQWTFNSPELEQDQAFAEYLKELDETISEDELVEWSHDIDLFMEGLSNPDKLEAVWE